MVFSSKKVMVQRARQRGLVKVGDGHRSKLIDTVDTDRLGKPKTELYAMVKNMK